MDSSNTIFLSLTSFIYILLLAIIYFSKEKVKTSENNIFTKLLIVSLLSLFSELYITIIPPNMEILLFRIALKAYLILCVLWLSYFMEYVFIITRNNQNRVLINYKNEYKSTYLKFWIANVIIIGSVILLPISFYNENGLKYSYGASVNLVFGLCAIYAVVMFIYIIKNIKNLKNKGYMPIIFLVILLSIVGIVQKINPGLLLANTCFALITTLMYYTMENPDIRKAKEYAFSKRIAEESRDKTLETLNDLSENLNTSLNKLQTFGYKKVDFNNNDSVKKDLKFIKKYCINFVDEITGLIEISKVESENLKVEEAEYETSLFLDELNNIILSEKHNQNINVFNDFNSDIPCVLYGDKDKILQLFLSIYNYLLDFAVSNELKISLESILAGRFCKLKFRFITDNSLNNFNDNQNIKYEKIKRLASLINAKMVINNKEDNEIILSINQRIISPYKLVEQEKENIGINVKYFNASNKRILIVNETNANLKKLLLLLSPYKVEIDIVSNINKMKEKLIKDKIYDIILVDEIAYLNSSEGRLINDFKQICGYEIKSIILVAMKDNSNKYLNKGFDDVILKPANKGNINLFMEKYLKD